MDENLSNKRKTSVDELNEQLYYRKDDFKQRPRRKIHDRDIKLEHDFPEDDFENWKQNHDTRKLPTSFFKKVFFGVLGFFILTLLVAAIYLYTGKKTVSGELISMEILGQPFVDGGESLQLQVRIQNFNEQALEFPDLVLSYPKDSREGGEKTFLRRSLENINEGDRVSEEFNITLFGQEGDVRKLEASLEYRIGGSNAIFLKESEHEVIIRSTPSVLSVFAPDEIVRGQVLELTVDLASNSNTIINNSLLDIDYPAGFEFIGATPEPDILNHIWTIPILRDEKETITVTGRLAALEGQGQSFAVNFGKRDQQRQNEIETLFNTLVHTIEVQRPFIVTELELNRSDDDIIPIRGGDEVNGEIAFVNTLGDALKNVVVTLTLDGNLYNPTGIRAQNGFFNSNTKTLTWDKTTSEEMKLIQPNETKTLSFNLPTQDLVGRTGSLANPELNLVVDVSGVEINGKVREAQSVSRATVIANSDIELIGKVDYEEGSFQNYGPMPPRVNQASSYTVTLLVTNSSNEIEDGKVSLFLPSYVSWKNAIAPSVEKSSVDYNETTREIVWDLKKLRAGLGINGSSPRTLSFQVEVLPSLSQVGDQVALTSDITLSGMDSFTDTQLSFKKTALENKLNNSKEQGSDGRIQN